MRLIKATVIAAVLALASCQTQAPTAKEDSSISGSIPSWRASGKTESIMEMPNG